MTDPRDVVDRAAAIVVVLDRDPAIVVEAAVIATTATAAVAMEAAVVEDATEEAEEAGDMAVVEADDLAGKIR